LEHLSISTNNPEQAGKVWLLVRKDRNNKRIREESNRYFDAPDTAHIEGKIARDYAIDVPMLMLFRQEGLEEQGWKGHPFWWPVVTAPENAHTSIFADKN
jgi:hypothetical protein